MADPTLFAQLASSDVAIINLEELQVNVNKILSNSRSILEGGHINENRRAAIEASARDIEALMVSSPMLCC